MRVGVIGLGIMGAPMARNLLRAGHAVTVHSRTRARVDALVADGAVAADSPAAVARGVEAVITMLPDTPDVEAVVAGPDGVLDGASPGLLAIDMSTIAPAAARALAAKAAGRGVAFVDAPVSGGEQGAITGTLSIMAGGERAAFDRAAPLFAALGRQATWMGGPGQGQMTKLVNQVVGAATLAAVAEGVILATRAGLDPDSVVRDQQRVRAGRDPVAPPGAAVAAMGRHRPPVLPQQLVLGDVAVEIVHVGGERHRSKAPTAGTRSPGG